MENVSVDLMFSLIGLKSFRDHTIALEVKKVGHGRTRIQGLGVLKYSTIQ